MNFALSETKSKRCSRGLLYSLMHKLFGNPNAPGYTIALPAYSHSSKTIPYQREGELT